jgi:glycerol-3-phosphate dehydrogenase
VYIAVVFSGSAHNVRTIQVYYYFCSVIQETRKTKQVTNDIVLKSRTTLMSHLFQVRYAAKNTILDISSYRMLPTHRHLVQKHRCFKPTYANGYAFAYVFSKGIHKCFVVRLYRIIQEKSSFFAR